MSHDNLPPPMPSALLDADRARPGLWRWIAFWTLVLVVVSLWVPVIPSEPTGTDGASTPFTPANWTLLLASVVLAVLVVPATLRIRLVIAVILLGTTLLAWALEEPIRRLLGGPFLP